VMLLQGDCLIKLKEMPDNSVDSVVSDPPYGLSFMGKKWDHDVPSEEIWRECLRVLKPGGHLLAFFGTRTYHRGVVRIEDAGFEIRDQVMWIYGSGFPKSTNIALRIDKESGAAQNRAKGFNTAGGKENFDKQDKSFRSDYGFVNEYKTEAAKQWQGWGTALKPANEPIVLARKPLEGTIAQNVLKWGVGGLNIDASRIATDENDPNKRVNEKISGGFQNEYVGGAVKGSLTKPHGAPTQGRWPANILFDEEAAAVLDAQSGILKTGGVGQIETPVAKSNIGFTNKRTTRTTAGSSGGASRFFYCAKASKSERNAGLEGMPKKAAGVLDDDLYVWAKNGDGSERNKKVEPRENFHPTVKPTKLMEYLITLITPPGGTVLDPFMGSGSTGVAARNLNREFIGIELSEEYFAIAQKRLA
jgi:DNA modification methylase